MLGIYEIIRIFAVDNCNTLLHLCNSSELDSLRFAWVLRHYDEDMAADEMREMKNRIAYTVMIVRDFGDAHNLTPRQAHNYLRRYKALDYLDEFYDVEHTLSPEDTLHSLDIISKRNGGQAWDCITDQTRKLAILRKVEVINL